MTTEDKQRIVFEQGAPLTGDSGERGNATTSDGGVESIKPVNDGERAHDDVFRRPEENIRLRTERLRDAGEQAKYENDQMRWAFTMGRADGAGVGPLEPLPTISWDPVTGIFTVSDDVVLQPINTPAVDKQEVATFTFNDGSNTGSVLFSPSAGPQGKRAYNGANLLRIKWYAVPAAELATAIVPNQCDLIVSGDPGHIVSIYIRNDNLTQLADITTAISASAAALLAIGIGGGTSGTASTYIEYGDITDPDFAFTGTFDRELHYIPPSTFSDFFAVPNSLDDGDTLGIEWTYYVEPDPGIDGRRQRIPSNISVPDPDHTTVFAAQLFISTDNPERIPYSIPLCKRVGDDLFWLDGTVCAGSSSEAIYFGEHGYTVERIVNGADTMLKDPYPDPGGTTWSLGATWVPTTQTIAWWLDLLLTEVNHCARMYPSDIIQALWTYRGGAIYHATTDDTALIDTQVPQDYLQYLVPGDFTSTFNATGNSDAWHSSGQPTQLRLKYGTGTRYVYNRPLTGFWCRAYPFNPGEPTPNQMIIGGGEAYVAGRYMRTETFTLTNLWDGVTGKGGLTTNTKNLMTGWGTWTDYCIPLYVWLRADGTFHIDAYGPEMQYGSIGEVGNMSYRPHSGSGLVGGSWGDEEYTLVDVCWLVQGNTGGTGDSAVRVAGYVPMGNGYFQLEYALYRDTGPTWYPIAPIIYASNNGAGFDTVTLTNDVLLSLAYAWRTPGVPVVSNKGHFSVNARADLSASTRTRIYIGIGGIQNSSVYRWTMPARTSSAVAGYELFPSTIPNDGPVVVFEQGDATNKLAEGPVTVMQTVSSSPPQTVTRVFAEYEAGVGDDGTLRVQYHFHGFWWDKYQGMNVTGLRETAPV